MSAPSAAVMGIRDFGPVGGTPIVPPSYLTIYFLAFVAFLTILYVYFYRKKRPTVLWEKIRLLVIIALLLKVTILAGGSLVAAYWLMPSPSIRRTIPSATEISFAPTQRIEIVFDRPVSRGVLEKSIYPDTPGRWVFEDSIYTTHLYRKLVFYPTKSFMPDTSYTISLSHIQNLIKISEPYEHTFTFETQPAPQIKSVSPTDGLDAIDPSTKIIVNLDQPNDKVSELNFEFEPSISYKIALDASSKVYTITPDEPLRQGTKYTLNVQKSDVLWNLEEGIPAERTAPTQVYKGSFTTKEAPGITSFEPATTNAAINSELVIHFSQQMDPQSVQKNFSILPTVSGRFSWSDNQTLSFKPTALAYDTEYRVTISKGSQSSNGFFEEDVVKTFKTVGPVKVSHTIPQNGQTAINVRASITLTFDQPVDHHSAEQKFSITPTIAGSFTWEGNTMAFTPNTPFSYSTPYIVLIGPGVQSIDGQNSKEEYKLAFTTQDTSAKLAVPAYLQKYTLSCEIASLRMALNFRGANVTEDDLIPKVGVDPTPHNGNIWGNPNIAFVGNIAGTQMVNGYGVYWAPIAKAARSYRNAQEFQSWTVEQLTKEIGNGNPIIVWVYSHLGTRTSWNTPDGTSIYAVRDEHAVVVVGFVGSAQNPTQLIINDPLSGQVYWSRGSFDKKWNIFGNSGVVVY